MCILWLRLGDSPSPGSTSRKTHVGLAWAWSSTSCVKGPRRVLGGWFDWAREPHLGGIFSPPSLFWGHLRLSVTQSTGTAMGNVQLLRDPRDLLQYKAFGWCFPPFFSSPIPNGVMLSHSPVAPGWPSVSLLLSSFLSRRGRKEMLLPLLISAVAKASREAQIHPSLIVLFRLFWPTYFFFYVFQGELKHTQLGKSFL